MRDDVVGNVDIVVNVVVNVVDIGKQYIVFKLVDNKKYKYIIHSSKFILC